MTTAMCDTWVEINPQTAHTIGVKNDDVVKISSALGDVEAIVYEYPAIHPQAIAIPLGQGHTGPGHFAKDVGANPLELLDSKQNEAGNLAYLETRVKVTPTGKRRQLARYESKAGVYGQRQGESSSRTSGG